MRPEDHQADDGGAEAGDKHDGGHQVFDDADLFVMGRMEKIQEPFYHDIDHLQSQDGKNRRRQNGFIGARSREVKHRSDNDKNYSQHYLEISLVDKSFS